MRLFLFILMALVLLPVVADACGDFNMTDEERKFRDLKENLIRITIILGGILTVVGKHVAGMKILGLKKPYYLLFWMVVTIAGIALTLVTSKFTDPYVRGYGILVQLSICLIVIFGVDFLAAKLMARKAAYKKLAKFVVVGNIMPFAAFGLMILIDSL